MNAQLTLLIELQEIDNRIRTHRGEQSRIPQQLSVLEQRAEENKAGLERTREALANAQKAKRDRDRDLEEGAAKVEKLKARTSEIKNNKEYQAMLKEIETAEQENKKIEDDILKLMENIDAATAEIANAEKKLSEENASIESERKQLEADIAKTEAALKEEEKVRSELAGRIDEGAMSKYRRLSGITGGKIVVEVRGESCSGCFMSFPPRTYVIVKKNESIVTCPNCHRILYFKEMIAPGS
ncbi:MAG: C4-type zinc ribbon domain-containing protein [Nitrospirota bacterium]|nr:C4-type zinc ribbon domain-containing protein [Nitrospirota bacterium]